MSLATCGHFNNNLKPVWVQLDVLYGVCIVVETIFCNKRRYSVTLGARGTMLKPKRLGSKERHSLRGN